MRRVSYQSVMDRVAGLLQGLPGAAPAESGLRGMDRGDVAVMGGFIQEAGKDFWERYGWPELLLTERRMFRPVYNAGTVYEAGAEVFLWGTQGYYQALRAVPVNEAPAEQVNGDYVLNAAYWGEAAVTMPVENWNAGVAYAVGTIVAQHMDGKVYQCHTAHTNQGPPNASFWGERTDFVRTLSFTQEGETAIWQLKRMYDTDPRVCDPRAVAGHELRFDLDGEGALARADANVVWILFWPVCPMWVGGMFDAAREYVVGERIYYRDAAEGGVFLGDFWECVAGTLAGESPVSARTKWRREDFPAVMREMVALRVAGEMEALHGGGAMTQGVARGEMEFEKQVMRVEREQGQVGQVRVMVR